MCTVVRDSFINRFWFSAVFRRRVFTGASVHPWKIRKAPIAGVKGVKKKKWKEKTMSRGFDRVTDVWQLKIVQLFGAVRIPRRSFRTVLRPFFVFPFIFILPFPSLFFSHFASSSCVPAFGHTRPPGIEPIVGKLAKSPWKNRALSNSTLSLLVSNLFESKFLLFFFFYFNSIFFFITKILSFYLFYVESSRGTR